MAVVQDLMVYPIKGCVGIAVKAAAVTSTGLPFDRQWMVVQEATGKFVTQRQIPKLCKVTVTIAPEALLGELQAGAAMVLSAPGMIPLQVPLTDTTATSQTRSVVVWEWSGVAADEGDEAAAWFSSYLDTPVRLVRHIGHSAPAVTPPGPTVRPVDPEFAPGHEVKFADGFPVMIARQANLCDLNARLSGAGEAELPMNRFRPNIVLAGGGAAWSDDDWLSITVSSSAGDSSSEGSQAVVLQYVRPCSRCKVTTINQETAEEGMEPLTTLGTFRTGKDLGYAEQRKAWTHTTFFGWMAAVNSTGLIRLGDAVTPVLKAI